MKLIPVMIVDDDFLVIQDLKSMVDWEALGFRIVATASNGKKALALFRTYQPQLLITDIRMPYMDGLDLIETIQGISKSTCILILTAYDDFKYAKRAIENNVADYLLKNEIAPDKLESKLLAIHDRLLSSQNIIRLSFQEELKAYFQTDATEDGIEDFPQLAQIAKKEFYFFLCVKKLPLTKATQRYRKPGSITEQLTEQFKTGELDGWQIPIAFSMEQIGIGGVKKHRHHPPRGTSLDKLMQRLHHQAQPASADPLFIVYYSSALTLVDFKKVFARTLPYIEFRQYFSSSPVIPIRDINVTMDQSMTQFDFSLLRKYTQDPETLFRLLDDYLSDLFRKQNLHSILSFFSDICTHFEILSQYGLSFKEEYFFDSCDQLSSWLKKTYRACLESVQHFHASQYPAVVKKAISYMKANYKDPTLSGEKIADFMQLSYGRLGVVFKQGTGKTIVEYLTDIRVEKAVQLLEHSNYKIYEIAEMVGYNSSQYFSQIMIKKTGKRPLDFRHTAR